jgi:RHS repeat-associated protein
MRIRLSAIALFLFALPVASLRAQTPAATPDENPEGNTGALKAQITTGGSYDAHSGNATRSVTDLHVPGALGVYGLDFTRHWNSIPNDYYNAFAELPSSFGASGWSHSWEWHATEEETLDDLHGDGSETVYTTAITITFPDGHANRYKITRSSVWHFGETGPPDPRCGPPYTIPEQNAFTAAPYDLLKDMAPDGSQFWLYLADGGAVQFIGIWPPDMTSGHARWTYQATKVFDPHGLQTQLDYDGNGRLTTVTQEGGRWLSIIWGYHEGSAAPVIDRVDTGGYAGAQSVVYNYTRYPDTSGSFLTLTSVIYPEGASAIYTYGDYYGEDENSGHYNFPLLKTADDPRYAGAMTRIFYTYNGGSCPVAPAPSCDCLHRYFQCVPTSIAAEKSADHVDQFGQHIPVSSFNINCFSGTRTETSGLGGSRTFYFGDSAGGPGTLSILGYQLAKVTDFAYANPPPAGLPFEWQNYQDGQPRQIWDGRNIETEAIVTPGDFSGQPGEIHHVTADGSYQVFNRVNPGASDAQDFSKVPNRYNHWLFSHRDERWLTTTYRRDSRRRVADITYHDGSSEHFSYNEFNQVTTHTLASGAVQHYEYNGLNQLERTWNSVDGESAATTYTYYGPGNHPEWTGLVATELDPRAASSGAAYSAMMEYNGRHQVTKVHYPPTGIGPDPTVLYKYDAYGNRIEVTNELGQTTKYTYDSYRRCIEREEPLNAPNWNGSGYQCSRKWNWYYDRYFDGVGTISASAHTSTQWRVQVEPAYNAAGDRRLSAQKFDYNNRIIEGATGLFEAADGSWHVGPDTELHQFTYDENGQKKTYTDPQGRLATYDYDLRNRLWKTNETVNTVPRTTETLYDATGNKTDVTFPDTRSEHWRDYDPFGQAGTFIDERNNTTNLTYQWGPMKKLRTVTTYRDKDGGGTEPQPTTFTNDGMGRLRQTDFPDTSHEDSSYEFGQLKTWRTRKGQTKYIHYDARGREDSHSWENLDGNCDPTANSGAAPCISRSWDDAGRLTSITNIWSSIDYGYDASGQVMWEGNEIAGSGGRTQTNYFRYPSGEVAHLHYPGGVFLRRDYTARGQLEATGWDDDDSNWWMKLAAYTYLPDGKVGQVDYGNGVRTGVAYDQRGFPQIIDHYKPALQQDISWRQYWRDDRDRITAFQKSYNPGSNPLENGRGDRFRYDEEGQLVEGWYNATDPANSGAGNTRYDGFSYDALGNRGLGNYVASRGQMDFTKKDNGLNQYRAWWPYSYTNYDDDISGWGSPANANGVLMQDGWITAGFNALNQPMYIWSANVGWTYFGYDPLGRCVKRWTGDSGDVYSNPATYFQYDGWNLLQEGSNAWGPARVYVHGNRMDEIVWSYNTLTGDQAFHHYDARGHCILLTDSLGNISEQYEYDAFGWPYFYDSTAQPLNASSFGNRFLFTGREWLSDLHLYDFRNRMYQPELGRFLQPDPKEFEAGDYNLYRYCGNDPVNRNDPMGLDGLTITGKGDWDFFNGRVALAQIALQQPAASLKVRYENYSDHGPGGRPVVERALKVLKDTAKGQEYYSKNDTVTIRPTDRDHHTGYYRGEKSGRKFLYLNPKDGRFYDDYTYRKIPFGERPPETDQGRASVIGHEFGHALLGAHDESPQFPLGRNVRDNENAVRAQVVPRLAPRRAYGGNQFPIDE